MNDQVIKEDASLVDSPPPLGPSVGFTAVGARILDMYMSYVGCIPLPGLYDHRNFLKGF